MRKKKTTTILVWLLLVGAIISPGCDAFNPAGSLSSTQSAIQTIPPATLTAISLEEEKNRTPVPDPMGIPLADLKGLELELWYLSDQDQTEAVMNSIVERFNEEKTWGFTVKAVNQGLTQNPREAVETAFMEGLVPNLLIGDILPFSGWYEKGYLIDLEPYLQDPTVGYSDSELKDFFQGVMDPNPASEEPRTNIPFIQSIQVLYYNRSWGKELGFSIPPESFDDLFEQACAAANDERELSGESSLSRSGLLLYPDAGNIAALTYAYNGSIFDHESGAYNFTSWEVRKVAKDWLRLRDSGCGVMISGYPNPMAPEIEIERFNQRDALMIMNSSLFAHQIRTGPNQTGRADDWAMIPFIGPEGDKIVLTKVEGIGIFDTTPEEKLGSWLFLTYLTQPENQAEWAKINFSYPASKTATRKLRDFQMEDPAWAKGIILLRYGKIHPTHPSWEIVQLALGDAFEEILLGDVSDLSRTLSKLEDTVEELISYDGID
jgi:ABC-type glycerol-3-phosphate transport system substrate-binding protein